MSRSRTQNGLSLSNFCRYLGNFDPKLMNTSLLQDWQFAQILLQVYKPKAVFWQSHDDGFRRHVRLQGSWLIPRYYSEPPAQGMMYAKKKRRGQTKDDSGIGARPLYGVPANTFAPTRRKTLLTLCRLIHFVENHFWSIKGRSGVSEWWKSDCSRMRWRLPPKLRR